MHQPPGNLKLLADTNQWEARQIMLCYDRPLKYAWRYPDVARFCVGSSGILLEQFQKLCEHTGNARRLLEEIRRMA